MGGLQGHRVQKSGLEVGDNRLVLSYISNSSCPHKGNAECGRYDLRKDLRRVVRLWSSCLNTYLFLLHHGVVPLY